MEERGLIYSNLLNGVAPARIAQAYRKTEPEVMEIFRFVSRKIKSYLFLRCRPPIFCDLLNEARNNRHQLLQLLPKLKLEKEPQIKNVINEVVKGDPEEVATAFNDLRGRMQ